MWPSGRCGCGRTRRVRSRDECGQDQKARRERLHQGELSSIVLWFVSQPVHNFEGDESGAWSFWKDGHSIAFAWRATPRCQCATCQVGQNAARSCPTLRRELFGTLQNVLINIERRSHLMNITHQSSDVNAELEPISKWRRQKRTPGPSAFARITRFIYFALDGGEV